ncbi:MAG: 3-oxoacyl-[acyl-carrier-protein] synthase III C-terminal domain-containing protein [Aliidongia sp.]
MVHLISIGKSTPKHSFSTDELLATVGHKFSPEMIKTIRSLGVERRHSVMDNFPEFLLGARMNPTSSAVQMSLDAVESCLDCWGGDPSRIGLLVAATNTPDRMLPSLASALLARTHGLLSRAVESVSMQAQGCSALLKSVEAARWYVAANPGKLAVVLTAEAHTPFLPPLTRSEYHSFRDIALVRKRRGLSDDELESLKTDTAFAVQSMLFGDGAVALLIGNDDGNKRSFGPTSHLTNVEAEDEELLTMTADSSHPLLAGRAQYFMKPSVPNRGAYYAKETVRTVLENSKSSVSSLEQIGSFLIHTGSKKILDGVCSTFNIDRESPKVRRGYDVLNNYGNLSSASMGFMLAEEEVSNGTMILVSFGVGFSASAGIVSPRGSSENGLPNFAY